MGKLESKFQAELIEDLREIFADTDHMILKNDANYLQGVPDLLILVEGRWAALECKKHAKAEVQPNQPYYVDKMRKMSYASFIFPENKEQVLHELQLALRPSRKARASQRI